jgi:hypothetical protein
VAVAAALAEEARRVAAHPLGLRMPARPVRRRQPRMLEMHRERPTHSPAIRVAAADGGVDAAAAVQPAARRRARPVPRLKLQQFGYAIDRRKASRGLRRRTAIRTANRAQMCNAEIAGALEHRQAVIDEQGALR